MRKLVWLVALIPLVLAACSSHTETQALLHLGGGDISEGQAREEVRVALLNTDYLSGATLCRLLTGLSDEEASRLIVDSQAQQGVRLVQEANPEDRIRAAAIFKEECDRVYWLP